MGMALPAWIPVVGAYLVLFTLGVLGTIFDGRLWPLPLTIAWTTGMPLFAFAMASCTKTLTLNTEFLAILSLGSYFSGKLLFPLFFKTYRHPWVIIMVMVLDFAWGAVCHIAHAGLPAREKTDATPGDFRRKSVTSPTDTRPAPSSPLASSSDT